MAEQKDTHLATYDVAAGADISQHRLVRFDSSGNLVVCGAGEYPLGPLRAFTEKDKPGVVRLLQQKEGTIKCVAGGAITKLDDVYTAAAGKVLSTNSGIRVGKALVGASGDGSVIEVLPDLKRVPMVNTAASAVIGASSVAEADFDKTFTVPAADLKAGSVIKVTAAGIIVNANTTPQWDLRVYAGTEVIIQATVAGAVQNDQFLAEAEIVVRSVGATGKLIASGKSVVDIAGTAVAVDHKAEATEDTTGGLLIKASGQFDASHADNTARLDILKVEHLR